ncbi:diguanylate cyclase [Cyanothece sp. BG0011]|uniref:diguanylate cyclase n=1 Tax=Cyanothece sp. BG0011 TaxID=2082950 RepID=UPI000D1E6B80|nr:diguanylate cyclase [Cyanothece sp. BG0011]
MQKFFTQLFSHDQYIPHGHCYLWQPSLLWLHIISDGFIAIAYFSIPIILLYFIRQRQDMPFKGVIILFGAFILSCGTTHIFSVITLYIPIYWLSGAIKSFTAMISLYTAISLIPIVPKALALRSPYELEVLNRELESKIKEKETAEKIIRQLNEELENRVKRRTAELEQTNTQLKIEVQERENFETALRENQRFTQRIADLTPNLLYIYDLIDNKTIYCNRFITEILGYTLQEVNQMEADIFSSLIHPEDQGRMKQYRERCMNLKDDSYLEIECRLKDSQNNWHWIQTRKTVFSRNTEQKSKQILTIASDITLKKETELSIKNVNQQLGERVQELETRTQEMILLGEMTDFLQACLSISEAETTLSDLLKPIFPEFAGAVFTLKPSHDLLELIANWGENLNTNNMINPEQCWGLRRGTCHSGKTDYPNLYCQHIEKNDNLGNTLCVPMMAQGDTLGLLYLHSISEQAITLSQKRLAEAISKQIAISLANLKLRETLQYQSFRDPLTGLFNRRYLDASIDRELHRVVRENKPLGIIMLDVDHFKQFNDTFGHEAGDMVLKSIGTFLQENVRQSDIACRFGGEEFTIILPHASLENAIERAEQLRLGIKQLHIQYSHQSLGIITVSLGVSAFPNHGENPKVLLQKADLALLKAKEQGRDRLISADLLPQ